MRNRILLLHAPTLISCRHAFESRVSVRVQAEHCPAWVSLSLLVESNQNRVNDSRAQNMAAVSCVREGRDAPNHSMGSGPLTGVEGSKGIMFGVVY